MKSKGRTLRQGGMIGTEHLRKAAIAAGVIKARGRLGMHSLATFLISQGWAPKTVQGMLRHSNVQTTLQLHAHCEAKTCWTLRAQCWAHFSRRREPRFNSGFYRLLKV
jgi:site-specific recombinase XerD